PGFRVPEDIQKYRLPKKGMMTILLRQKPAEAQTAHAERLEREGWYDEKWTVTEWFPHTVQVGRKPNYAREAGDRAFRMWKKHGEDNGLLRDENWLREMRARADKYREVEGLSPNEVPDFPPGEAGEEERKNWLAQALLQWYSMGRSKTNFPHFYH